MVILEPNTARPTTTVSMPDNRMAASAVARPLAAAEAIDPTTIGAVNS